MRKFIFAILLLLFVNSCREEKEGNTEIKTKHLKSILHHVSFDYPSNWELTFIPDSSNPHAIIALKNPIKNPEDKYSEELNIWWEALPVPVDDSIFHQANIAQIKIINDSIEIENVGLVKNWQTNFYKYEMNFTPDGGKNFYHVNGYSVVKDSIGYSINFTSEKNSASQFQHEIDIILNSFKPL